MEQDKILLIPIWRETRGYIMKNKTGWINTLKCPRCKSKKLDWTMLDLKSDVNLVCYDCNQRFDVTPPEDWCPVTDSTYAKTEYDKLRVLINTSYRTSDE